MLLSLTLAVSKNVLVNIKTFQNNTLKRITAHFLFWLFYVLFFGLFYGKYGHDYRLHLIETSFMLPFVMVATYCTIYGILPYYLNKRKWLPTILLLGVLIFVVTLSERVFIRWLNDLPLNSETLFGVSFLYLMLETNFMVGLGFAVKFVKKWFEQQQEKHDMEKKHLENELNLLKGQLHPHFLFNTMNNLYALSLEKSSLTSEGIARISELLRSVLYECNEPEITLDKEIALIRNYIDLEKMRYSDNLEVSFEVNGSTKNCKIAPLMLFTFVENSFKHGGSSNSNNSYVRLKLEITARELKFEAENSKTKRQQKQHVKQGGIGLVNVKKRLQLIYNDRYSLTCKNEEDKYKVCLQIQKKKK